MLANTRLAATIVAFTLAAAPAVFAQNSVVATNVWARATAPGVPTGVVYLTLTSPVTDKLTEVSTPLATRAAVHESRMDGTIMRMRQTEGGLDLPPGQAVTLRPSGTHIMLEGLKAPLKPGGSVPLHLIFQHAPPIDVQAQVLAAGASAPGR